MDKAMLISIVIPVYNSEKSISNIVRDLESVFRESYQHEIILVNDGSRDDSDGVCRDLHSKFQGRVVYLELSRNFGEHNAVMAGLNIAKGDWVIIMDDDQQNPAEEAKKLTDYAISSNYEVIYAKYDDKKHGLGRNLGSWFNDKVANLMLQKPKELYLCSFKIISAKIVKEIICYELPFPYIDGIILSITRDIGTLKVKHGKRHEGKSGYTIGKLIHLWSNMFTNFSIIPLRIAIVCGFIFSGIGFVLGIYTVIEKIMNPEIPLGYASLFVAMSFFSGMILIALGMLGEYIGRIFLSINRRPQFVIKNKYDKDN
jgi:glycosyltransferase involved in cell wall biosynthesis